MSPEKRDIQQIGSSREAEAKAAKAAIDAGKTFDALAAERKLQAGRLSLGTLTQADLAIDPARAKAAFALPLGGISQPVKGTFGYVLMQSPRSRRARAKSHDEIKLALQRKLAPPR